MSNTPLVRPWDSPGLPPRTAQERCGHHRNLCNYRDDDPERCPNCHASRKSDHCTCTEKPHKAPPDKRTATIRAWAESEGVPVATKGRVPKTIIEAYEQATK